MYKVEVFSHGKFNNVELGPRYTLTFKSALSLARLFLANEAEFTISKFARIHGDIFCWSDCLSEKQEEQLYFGDDEEEE